MLFFAIVYLVEGIGQARVGIIYQPLTHYLKETGWTALQVTAYFAVFWSGTGQTPGMRLLRVRVIAPSGATLTPAPSRQRERG